MFQSKRGWANTKPAIRSYCNSLRFENSKIILCCNYPILHYYKPHTFSVIYFLLALHYLHLFAGSSTPNGRYIAIWISFWMWQSSKSHTNYWGLLWIIHSTRLLHKQTLPMVLLPGMSYYAWNMLNVNSVIFNILVKK